MRTQLTILFLNNFAQYRMHLQCVVCKASPIEGVRYRCFDCKQIKAEETDDNSNASANALEDWQSVNYCRRCHFKLMTTQSSLVKAASDQPLSASNLTSSIVHNSQHEVEEVNMLLVKLTIQRILNKINSKHS